MNLKKTAERFTKALIKQFPDSLVAVVLFGSVARGTDRPGSDIDMVVVMRGLPPGRYVRRLTIEPVFETLAKGGCFTPINCHLKTPEEALKPTLLYYDLTEDARILHDTNGFFRDILEKVSEKIRQNGAIRKKWANFSIGTSNRLPKRVRCLRCYDQH